MRKKLGLFWFAAALLGAALIFSGCETEADTETKYVSGAMIHLDTVVSTVDDLKAALAVTDDLAIGFDGTDALDGELEIGTGKAVYILNNGKLETSGENLIVAGIVYVGVGGELDASSGNVIVTSGGISVLSEKTVAGITGVGPGTLKVAAAANVNDGADAPDTVLGTDKVRILGELKYATGATAFASTTALSTPFGYVGNGGMLDISDVTVTGSTPSTLVAAIPQGKNLIAKAAADEASTTTTLTIPANANITLSSSDALGTITGLAVSGTLNIGATTTLALATGVTTSGDGKIVLTTGTETVLSALLSKAGSTLVIEQSVAATFAADQTVNAGTTLFSTKAITVDAAKTLTVAGTVRIEGTGSLTVTATGIVALAEGGVLATADSGTAVFGQTTFSGNGLWTAGITGGDDDETITITSSANGAAIAFAAGSGNGTAGTLTAGGFNPTITQAAAASNNLAIGADTTIALGGTNSAALGTIVLTGDSNAAKLTLIGTITGQTGLTTAVAAADIAITNATLTSTTITGLTGTNKNLGSLTGTAANNTITAGAANNDVTLNAEATITS